MTVKTLEIDIRSAEGLKLNRRFIKRKTFAVARIGEKCRKSDLDVSGGSSPTWNYKSEMPMKVSVTQFINIEVYYRTGSGREKKIGEAKVPTTDFMGRYSPEGHLNFLSYRLRDEFGDKCGIVNISIMVKPNHSTEFIKSSSTAAVKDYGACSSQTGLWRPRSEPPSIDGYGGRIVTGVPVWCVLKRPT